MYWDDYFGEIPAEMRLSIRLLDNIILQGIKSQPKSRQMIVSLKITYHPLTWNTDNR